MDTVEKRALKIATENIQTAVSAYIKSYRKGVVKMRIKQIRIKHLKCPECGAELELDSAYDGMHEEAGQYSKFSPNWGWLVSLNCTRCSRIYPICRTSKYQDISEIVEEE